MLYAARWCLPGSLGCRSASPPARGQHSTGTPHSGHPLRLRARGDDM